MSETYRVRVRGHLDRRWSEWLGGLTLEPLDDGTTLLVGPVVDQAALFGVIAGVRDLGLTLVSLSCEAEPAADPAPAPGSPDEHQTHRMEIGGQS